MPENSCRSRDIPVWSREVPGTPGTTPPLPVTVSRVTEPAEDHPIYISPENLCKRWDDALTVKTLANWRSMGKGPEWICLSFNRILYYRDSVVAYEEERRRIKNSRLLGGKDSATPAD